ncbi:DUF4328 domain-containing protein [Nonomuraea cavernae]|uniref:DUF4328 domain-containing protein n=1 Tax=Nonomuraea cavernae TaxID=2045107 RepID=A0A918DQL7_9ACTN|nr:DUF4328 domain-containing protein [Nonomuraea cavernae]MCA2185670.1 DUF4328 domain-containing protein [Nonomuraea cavernae]GGO78224.1 hypothetical protein GCM10012289_59730 [Nonomuraea cavernae]
MARGENNVRYAQAPPTKAASAVYVTLVAQVLSLGSLVIFEAVRGRRLAAQLAAFGGRPHGADAEAVVGAVTVFAVLVMLVAGTTVAAAIAYLTWLVRARQVNDLSAPSRPVLTAWLVPGLNLVAPPVFVDEVWRGSHPQIDRRVRWLALLGAWWVSWLATLVLVGSRLFESSPGDLTGIGVPELACLSLAALLCAATVRKITDIQRHPAPLAAVQPVRPLVPPAPESAPLGQTG